jgi:uncharacterized DUF497 family protein
MGSTSFRASSLRGSLYHLVRCEQRGVGLHRVRRVDGAGRFVIAEVLSRVNSRRSSWRGSVAMTTIKLTEITFDPVKSAANERKRGLRFSLIESDFNWLTARVVEDTRKDYGERRFRAVGFIGARLHVVVYTPRGSTVHINSLRKANRPEERLYAAQT